MKLIIQIPCFNEAATLPATLADLPRAVPGFDAVETLVIDDGSRDGTAEVARAHGVTHLVRFPANRGLAATFRAGLDAALAHGADVIVNTDGDNQYPGAAIAELVRPIVEGRADVTIGVRDMDAIAEFSPLKKRLQRFGSRVVRRFSGLEIADATSGFRAFSRRAAARLNVLSRYTYTLETLIQAGRQNLAVVDVPIRANAATRASRLIRSNTRYVFRSAITIVRMFLIYEPLRALGTVAALLLGAAGLIGLRFVYFYWTAGGHGHVQSLILAAILAIIGFQTGVLGVLADLTAANRRLLEDLLTRTREQRLDIAGGDAGAPSKSPHD
jgi:glycosyltransferase involved in cell wall biosynthesis